MRRAILLTFLAFGLVGVSLAQNNRNVIYSGSMGDKALLLIDGQARTLALGASYQGVRLISIVNSQAQVEIDGRKVTLQSGVPASLGGGPRSASGAQIVLTATSGGHFATLGQINGRSVEFLVDTGATAVAISQAEAERINLNYKTGRRTLMQTANGPATVHIVTLNSVRVGDVEVYNVEAVVMPAPMSVVLLGNTFLTRFQMRRENDTLTLDKR